MLAEFRRKHHLTLGDLGVYLSHRSDPLFRKWLFEESERLKRFRLCHRGESCFIIGNGPSLNRMDLSLLRELNTFGLNKIYLMSKRQELNLSYLVSVNPLVIQQSAEIFESMRCPLFLSMRASDGVVKPRDHVYRLRTDATLSFQTDPSKNTAEGCTVTFVAMQLAYYMGFSQVFLIGVDHNFAAQGKPHEQQTLVGDDVNHFDPTYFAGQEWQLPDLEGSEIAYRLAKLFFEREGRRIYDATVDGKLQIFPKISYEEALDRYRSGPRRD